MLSLTIPINSNIVSGVVKIAWQTIPTVAIYKLSVILCSAFNLHYLYDRRGTLFPKKSILFTFTNVPTGHPPLVLALSLAILLHIILSLLLDLSLTGQTRPAFTSTLYRSVVADHPRAKPLVIDFKREFASADNSNISVFQQEVSRDKRLVSRRLLAAVEALACIQLNGTHHTTFAHAYQDIPLDHTLVPLDSRPPPAQCVTAETFQHEWISHRYKLSGFPHFNCDLRNLTVQYGPDEVIGTATPTIGQCDLEFSKIQCFRHGAHHCAAASRHKTKDGLQYMWYIPDAKNASVSTVHQMRDFDGLSNEEDRARFAANLAFIMAIGMRSSDFAAMYVSIANIEHDVELQRRQGEREVTVVNLRLLIPVLVVELLILVALSVAAVTAWLRWVVWKDRRRLIKFSSLMDVFSMVRRDGFSLRHERGKVTRVISLWGDEPRIFMNYNHVDDWNKTWIPGSTC